MFSEGMEHYQERRWREALTVFSAVRGKAPQDRAAEIMVERCERYIAEPPPADWAGAIVLREK
jgi:adenylate cyclase